MATFAALFSVTPTKFSWEYKDHARSGSQWMPFGKAQSAAIETAFKENEQGSCEVNVKGKTFAVDLARLQYKLTGSNVGYGQRHRTYDIRRDEVLSPELQARRATEDAAQVFIKKPGNRVKVEALFATHCDEDGDFDLVGFAEALGIDAENDVAILVVAFYCQWDEMGVSTKDQFVSGMSRMGCASAQDLKGKLAGFRAQLNFSGGGAAPSAFMLSFWKYLFLFFKAGGADVKKLPLELGVAVMSMVFEGRWPLLPAWRGFLTAVQAKRCYGMPNAMSHIGRDEWLATLRFSHRFYDAASMDGYDDDDEFWPSLMDCFAEDYFPKKGMGGGESKS